MRIGHCQMDCRCGEFEANLAKFVRGLERADCDRVEVGCLLECRVTGVGLRPDAGASISTGAATR
jgi:hypothetical protein